MEAVTLLSGCFASWILALGSKEIAATLPLIILLYEWYFFQDLRSDWLKRNWKVFFGVFAILGLVVFVYMGGNPFDHILAGYSERDFTMGERVFNQFRVVLFYISLLLYPHPSRLNLLHQVETSFSLTGLLTALSSLLIIVALIVCAIYLAKKRRFISFCILWFFINLAIESSIIALEMIFEHRLYLPMFGFALIMSYLLFHFLSNRLVWATLIALFITLSLGTATCLRNRVWQDRITLWSDVASKSPKSYRAHHNLGIAWEEQGKYKEAIGHFLEALQIKPLSSQSHNHLGISLRAQGRLEEAIAHFSEAVRIKPGNVQAQYNLGTALEEQGKSKEAIGHFLEALRIRPDYAEAHNNLGAVMLRQGSFKEAIGYFLEALRIKPEFAEAHNNLGVALARQGRLEEAIKHFSEALRIDPAYEDAKKNLELGLQQLGKSTGASYTLERP